MTTRVTSANALIMALSQDQRRVLSRWRALIYLRRASEMYAASERRWRDIPQSEQDAHRTIQNMLTSQHLESIKRAPNCFVLRDAFGRGFPIRELELLFELNPFTVVMHYSALEFHGFTLDQPKVITAWSDPGDFIPLGTQSNEWTAIPKPTTHYPKRVVSQRVEWFRGMVDTSFGIETAFDGPIPIRVTDRERSLIDVIQQPSRSGGIVNVFRAWLLGHDFIDLEKVTEYVHRYGIKVLRQRVGFLCEAVGLSHPVFDTWAKQSVRGGSSKLVGSEPFSPRYSERWNLSLNGPIEELEYE